MSGTRPTLDEYFDRARTDGIQQQESTLDLLLEYKTKAERQRRRRRAAAVTALSCLFLGAIGFEFSTHFSPASGHFAEVRRAPLSGSEEVHSRGGTTQRGEEIRPLSGSEKVHSPAEPSTPRTAPDVAYLSDTEGQTSAISAQSDRTSADSKPKLRQSSALIETDMPVHASAVPVYDYMRAEQHSSALAVSSADLLDVSPAVQQNATGNRFMPPVEEYATPFINTAEPPEREARTLALTVGAHYGTATSDISPINAELADLNFPTLNPQYRQTTFQAGIAMGDITLGVAYSTPYTESVTGVHKPLYNVAGAAPPTVVTTFAHKRWSTFGEYSFAIAENIRLDAGAQVSFTSYELGFESNYTPALAFDPNNHSDGTSSGGTSNHDLWTGMWNAIGTSGLGSNFNEKTWVERPIGGIATQSVGISPTLGLSWRALPALRIQCRVSYMFNTNHEWRLTSNGAPVTGIGNQLRMNEYSISIGASLYQWLF